MATIKTIFDKSLVDNNKDLSKTISIYLNCMNIGNDNKIVCLEFIRHCRNLTAHYKHTEVKVNKYFKFINDYVKKDLSREEKFTQEGENHYNTQRDLLWFLETWSHAMPPLGLVLYVASGYVSPVWTNWILNNILKDNNPDDKKLKSIIMAHSKARSGAYNVDISFFTKLPEEFVIEGNESNGVMKNWKRRFLEDCYSIKFVKNKMEELVGINLDNCIVKTQPKLDAIRIIPFDKSKPIHQFSRKFLTILLYYSLSKTEFKTKTITYGTPKDGKKEKTQSHENEFENPLRVWKIRLEWLNNFDANKIRIIRSFARYIIRLFMVDNKDNYLAHYRNITKQLHASEEGVVIINSYGFSAEQQDKIKHFNGREISSCYKDVCNEFIDKINNKSYSPQKEITYTKDGIDRKIINFWFTRKNNKKPRMESLELQKILEEFNKIHFIEKTHSLVKLKVKEFIKSQQTIEQKTTDSKTNIDKDERKRYNEERKKHYMALEIVLLFVAMKNMEEFSKKCFDNIERKVVYKSKNSKEEVLFKITDNIFSKNDKYFKLVWHKLLDEKNKQQAERLNAFKIPVAPKKKSLNPILSIEYCKHFLALKKYDDFFIIDNKFSESLFELYENFIIEFQDFEEEIIHKYENNIKSSDSNYISFKDVIKHCKNKFPDECGDLHKALIARNQIYHFDIPDIENIINSINFLEEFRKKIRHNNEI